MLTGAVLERMGGHGEVTAALVSRKGGVLGSVKAFNLPDASYTGLRSCMLADLLALMSSAAEGGDASANGKDEGRGEQGEGVEGPTGRGGGRAAEGRGEPSRLYLCAGSRPQAAGREVRVRRLLHPRSQPSCAPRLPS